MAGSEPVTSPDQHKPGTASPAGSARCVIALVLLAMLCGNHEGKVEDIWLVGIAVLLLAHRRSATPCCAATACGPDRPAPTRHADTHEGPPPPGRALVVVPGQRPKQDVLHLLSAASTSASK